MKKLIGSLLLCYGMLNAQINVGENLKSYSFEDQFEKVHTLTDDTKKVIFVFTKDNGHIMKEFMTNKNPDFLSSKGIDFIADISGMPSLIARFFAIPDMKDSKYPIILIKDEEIAKKYKTEQNKEFITVITLDKKKVTQIKYIKTKKELEELF